MGSIAAFGSINRSGTAIARVEHGRPSPQQASMRVPDRTTPDHAAHASADASATRAEAAVDINGRQVSGKKRKVKVTQQEKRAVDPDLRCKKCRINNNAKHMICESCDRVHHLECFKIKAVKGDWYCEEPECQRFKTSKTLGPVVTYAVNSEPEVRWSHKSMLAASKALECSTGILEKHLCLGTEYEGWLILDPADDRAAGARDFSDAEDNGELETLYIYDSQGAAATQMGHENPGVVLYAAATDDEPEQ